MGKLWRGGVLLGTATVLLGLSLFTTFWVLAAGFDFDPNDYPGAYYEAEIPVRQQALAVALLVPGLSFTAAMLSLFAPPTRRDPDRGGHRGDCRCAGDVLVFLNGRSGLH